MQAFVFRSFAFDSRYTVPEFDITLGFRKKKGGNIYFQAELTPRGQIADWTEGDDKLMHEFMETVKGYNESNMKKHEEARGDNESFDTVVNE